MSIWETINIFWVTLSGNLFIRLVLTAVMLDTVLGLLRSVKEHKFNSCFGIDGAIRKIAMVLSVVILAAVDRLIGFNIPLSFVPEEIIRHTGITHLGICEFFCLLYIMYEAVSVLKNMCLCGLPIPRKWRTALQKWLNIMTAELENKQTSIATGGDDNADK